MRKKDFEDEPEEREIKANISKKARRIKKECFFQAIKLNSRDSLKRL
jgi:hypothetical protein